MEGKEKKKRGNKVLKIYNGVTTKKSYVYKSQLSYPPFLLMLLPSPKHKKIPKRKKNTFLKNSNFSPHFPHKSQCFLPLFHKSQLISYIWKSRFSPPPTLLYHFALRPTKIRSSKKKNSQATEKFKLFPAPDL